MNNTLLFYIESAATLRARRHTLTLKEEKLLKEMQDLIHDQAALDDQIFLWEKEIAKMRAVDQGQAPEVLEEKHWSFLKKLADFTQ